MSNGRETLAIHYSAKGEFEMPPEKQPYRVRYFLQAGSGNPQNYVSLATMKDQASVGAALKMTQEATVAGMRLSAPKTKPDATKTRVRIKKVATLYKKMGGPSLQGAVGKGLDWAANKGIDSIPLPVIGSVLSFLKDKAVTAAKDRYHKAQMGNPANHVVPEVTSNNISSAEYLIKEKYFDEIITKYEFVREALQNLGDWSKSPNASQNCRTTYNVIRSFRYLKKEHDQLVYLMDWMMSFLQCMERELEKVHDFWDKAENKCWGEVRALAAAGRQDKECHDCGKHPKKKCMRTYYKPGEIKRLR